MAMVTIKIQACATPCFAGRVRKSRALRTLVVRSSPEQAPTPSTSTADTVQPVASTSLSSIDGDPQRRSGKKRQAESTDAVSSFLTRRFGIAGGLAWLGFLAVGSLGEQVKTRLEVASEAAGTRDVTDAPEVQLPSGVTYRDLRIGGGSTPVSGYLAVVHYRGSANGVVFEDTRARGKPLVLLYGARPFVAGLCAGVEEGMASMRAGGKRIIKVPAARGFGDAGAVIRPTRHADDKSGVIPPGADLEYEVELERISIPPS